MSDLGLTAIGQHHTGRHLTVLCLITDNDNSCPDCGQRGIVRSTRIRLLVHPPIGLAAVSLAIRIRTYTCPDCRRRWSQTPKRACVGRSKLSVTARLWALKSVVIDKMSIHSIVKNLATSWNTVCTAVLDLYRSLLIADATRFDGVSTIGVVEHDTGLLIALDGVHRTSLNEFRGITDAVAYAFSQEAPLAIVVADLPSSIDDIVNDDVSTFFRRAERISLGNLTDEQVATVLAEPMRDGGKGIMSEALDLAVSVTQGYPYLVQVVGNLSWVAAPDDSMITVDHVQSVMEEATETLDQQIHAPTLAALSERQRDYLTAMGRATGPSLTRDVAEALSISKQAGNGLREQLMSLGIIESPGKGLVDFSISYLRDHLRGTMNAGGPEPTSINDSQSFSPEAGRPQSP